MLNATELMVNDNVGDSMVSQFTWADTTAFGDLSSHHTRIKNIISSRLGYTDQADDVAQEVFLSAMQNLKGFISLTQRAFQKIVRNFYLMLLN